MMSDVALRSTVKNPEYGDDLGVLRRQQQEEKRERTREVANGSPAGSFGSGRGFGSEEELRADPAYANYYYSNANLNPRLPPPLVSKEDWRFVQRFKGGAKVGGIGDRRRVNGGRGCDDGVDGDSSLFSVQPAVFDGKEESAMKQRKKCR
ncbi:hypothetical protein SESBI_29110 [Sesbania bispinosa]|nr:hypothetical protein SESBI_29110 [Sesbania bispinosa]